MNWLIETNKMILIQWKFVTEKNGPQINLKELIKEINDEVMKLFPESRWWNVKRADVFPFAFFFFVIQNNDTLNSI
jgi:hypothetical protein